MHDEELLLWQRYHRSFKNDLVSMMDGRSKEAIQQHAKKLGIKSDQSYICKKRSVRDNGWIASLPNNGRFEKKPRTEKQKLACQRGRKNYHLWTDEDDRAVRDLYPTVLGEELAERLGVTVHALHVRAILLGVKSNVSIKMRRLFADPTFKARWLECHVTRPGMGLQGHRGDIGHMARSTWEANYARILQYLNIEYEYEPLFYLNDGDRTRRYRPDFYVRGFDQYIELKGTNPAWSTPKGLEGFLLFRRQHPDKQILLITREHYNDLTKRFRPLIPLWETMQKNIKTHPHLFTGAQQVLQPNK